MSTHISHPALAHETSIDTRTSIRNGQLTLIAILATVGMLFAAFASAYLVRREGTDWVREPLPRILILTTIVLLASSVTIEIARAALKRHDKAVALWWAATTLLLGLAFLAGQLDAWQQLAARGIYMPTGPYGSFFYVLTAAHGLHVSGGIIVLCYLLWRLWRSGPQIKLLDVFRNCATYWHFVGGVWLLLYLLLLRY